MPDVGQLLREAREKKNLSLEDVERVLKIRQKFLIALENVHRNILDEIYMRGFLQNYARFLGLDAAQVLKMYNGHTEPPVVLPPPPPPSPAPFRPMDMDLEKKPRPYLRPLAIGVLVVVILGGMVGAAVRLARGAGTLSPAQATAAWAMTHVVDPAQTPANAGTPAPVAGKVTSTVTPTPGPTDTPTITPTPTPAVYTGVDLELVVSNRAWVQVRVDGQKVYEGILEAGTRQSWHGNDLVQLRCGNAGGVEAIVNGTSLGLLGKLGEVVDMEWQKETTPPSTPTPMTELDSTAHADSTSMTATHLVTVTGQAMPTAQKRSGVVSAAPGLTPKASPPTVTAQVKQ